MCCCDKNFKGGTNGGSMAGNGAASVAPPAPTAPAYTGCGGSGSGVVSDAPFLVTPADYANVAPIVSTPIIQRMGRRAPNNVYVYRPTQPGVIQVQSPKVGRY